MAGLRRTFSFPHYDMATWFPGHMFKGLQGMQKRIGDVDCIIEVHDARIPLTGRNPIFDRHAKMRPHILVLSKTDLVDKESLWWIKKNTERLGVKEVVLADMKKRSTSASNLIIDKMMEVIDHTDRFHRSKLDVHHVLVVGIPNVGKSSLINFLRNTTLKKKGRSAKVGGNPGVTKAVMERIKDVTANFIIRDKLITHEYNNTEAAEKIQKNMICEEPNIYLYDTPGVLTPKVESAEVALKLAACNTVRSHVLGEELICDYILYYLNRSGQTSYVELYGLDGPNDNIHEVLKAIAVKHDKYHKHRIGGEYKVLPNYQFAAQRMLKDFNQGFIATVNMDHELMFPGSNLIG